MKPILWFIAVIVFIVFCVPIGKWMVDDRWEYGYDWTNGEGTASQSRYLTPYLYWSAKRQGFLYERVEERMP